MDPSLFMFGSEPYDLPLVEDFMMDSIMPLSDIPNSSGSSPLGYTSSVPSLETETSLDAIKSSTTTLTKRRPIPRKGHTKSRLGCFNCKKRKIKCQETRTGCDNCIKAGMRCEYPRSRENAVAVVLSPGIQPQSTPTTFSMEDMQYFHHFLVRGYPHLPVGGDTVWTMEIPALAHQYDYLIHSMLALGASRLAMDASSTPAQIETSGLAHRVKAVQSLSAALKTDPKNKQEADARFATLMVLTFQSSCMPEGFMDFLTMLRGCVLSGYTIPDDKASCFASFLQKNHLETMEDKFDEQQLKDLKTESLDAATASLKALEPYCRTGVEASYHGVLAALISAAYVSPKQGEH
jgi:hypothetical protein